MQSGSNCLFDWRFADPKCDCVCFDCQKRLLECQVIMRRQYVTTCYRCIGCIFTLGHMLSIYTIKDFHLIPSNYQSEILDGIKRQREALSNKPTFNQLMAKEQSIRLKDDLHNLLLLETELPTVLNRLIGEFLISDQMIVEVDKTVHCLDNYGDWTHAQIKEIHTNNDNGNNNDLAYVMFIGWGSKWNEWIEFSPRNTRINACNCDPANKISLQGDPIGGRIVN